MNSSLQHKVFVTKQIPQSGRGPLPDSSTRMWSPITSTLIMGSHDAVLVDLRSPSSRPTRLATGSPPTDDGLRRSTSLTGTAITGLAHFPSLERFPGVTVRATEGTAKLMAAQNQPEFRAEFWDRFFPAELPAGEPDVTVVDERGFELEGVLLVPVEVGHTDTEATTMLHVPRARPARGGRRGLQRRASVPDGNWRRLRDRRVARRSRHCRSPQSRNCHRRPQGSSRI